MTTRHTKYFRRSRKNYTKDNKYFINKMIGHFGRNYTQTKKSKDSVMHFEYIIDHIVIYLSK